MKKQDEWDPVVRQVKVSPYPDAVRGIEINGFLVKYRAQCAK
jgi:hypothetical protein